MAEARDDPPNPALLERLRRGLPLEMDALGRFFFEGDEITHPRTVAFLRRCLDASAEGEVIVRIDEQWAYLRLRDLPLRVQRVLARDGQPLLVLDDQRELPLALDGLWEEPDRGLRCQVPARASGRALAARFSNTAQMDLAAWMRWPATAKRPTLEVAGRQYVIPEQPPTS